MFLLKTTGVLSLKTRHRVVILLKSVTRVVLLKIVTRVDSVTQITQSQLQSSQKWTWIDISIYFSALKLHFPCQ